VPNAADLAKRKEETKIEETKEAKEPKTETKTNDIESMIGLNKKQTKLPEINNKSVKMGFRFDDGDKTVNKANNFIDTKE